MDPEPTDAPAAVYAGWVMLDHHGLGRSHCLPADANNSAAACFSSAGKLVNASFRLAAPPGNSSLFLDWPDVRDVNKLQATEVIAAHGDSVLIQARDGSDLGSSAPFEYFVYRAGGPPSLSCLPHCYQPKPWNRDKPQRRREQRNFDSKNTGILRRGEDELAVAQLTVSGDSAELCVLRSGHLRLEWEIKDASVVYANGARGDEVGEDWWATDAAVPIGDRFLCWVDYYSGLVLCDDVFDAATPVLRYVPLPVEPDQGRPHHDWQRPFKHARNIGTTVDGAVRFVSIDRRCCCGGLLESSCPRSRFSFTLTTWTLDMDSMTWSTHSVLHSDELWALPGYEGLPRVTPAFPVLCMDDDDDAVCLMVRHNGADDADRRIWMIKVDTRSKTLLSVVPYNTARYKETDDDDESHRWINDESRDYFGGIGFIPSDISKYLN